MGLEEQWNDLKQKYGQKQESQILHYSEILVYGQSGLVRIPGLQD